MRETLRIGSAPGYSDPARPVLDTLLRRGGPAVLIFETLAERTLALAQLARRADPEAGYRPLLPELVGPALLLPDLPLRAPAQQAGLLKRTDSTSNH